MTDKVIILLILNYIGKYILVHKPAKWKYLGPERILKNILPFIYFESILSALVFVSEPQRSRYIYSFIMQSSENSWSLIPFLLWEFVMYYVCWNLFFYNVILMLTYWYDTSCWIKEMKTKK